MSLFSSAVIYLIYVAARFSFVCAGISIFGAPSSLIPRTHKEIKATFNRPSSERAVSVIAVERINSSSGGNTGGSDSSSSSRNSNGSSGGDSGSNLGSGTGTASNNNKRNDEVTQRKSRVFPSFDFMSKFFSGALQLFITDVDVLKLVSRICALTVWLALALSVAGSLGFDTKPLLGLASVAFISIGIGAKDLISNTIAGLFVAFARPFRRGSKITIHAPHGLTFSGRVLAINMRYLRLQQHAAKGTTLIPLNFCLNKPITVEEL